MRYTQSNSHKLRAGHTFWRVLITATTDGVLSHRIRQQQVLGKKVMQKHTSFMDPTKVLSRNPYFFWKKRDGKYMNDGRVDITTSRTPVDYYHIAGYLSEAHSYGRAQSFSTCRQAERFVREVYAGLHPRVVEAAIEDAEFSAAMRGLDDYDDGYDEPEDEGPVEPTDTGYACTDRWERKYLSLKVTDIRRFLELEGFERVHYHEFAHLDTNDVPQDFTDLMEVHANRELGVVVHFDTYRYRDDDGNLPEAGQEGINSMKMYYAFRPNNMEFRHRGHWMSSGCWLSESNGRGWSRDEPEPDDLYLFGYHDTRSGFRARLHRMKEGGKFLNPWPANHGDQRTFMFLSWADTKNDGRGPGKYHAWDELAWSRYQQMPEWFRQMVNLAPPKEPEGAAGDTSFALNA
jgi:hypothetical protein